LEILPTYKAKRSESITGNEVREAIQEQRPTVMKLIYALGICQAYSKQVEGDDMLYMVWRRYKRLIKSGKSYKLIIVSRDKDFHQLIDKDTSVWDPFKGMLLTKNNLKALFNYEPHEVVDYLCLLGDSSDNIPGYRGFGEKRVREFIDNYKLVNGQYRIKKPMRVDLIKLADTLAVNRKLIDLAMFHRKHQPNKTIEYFNSKRNPKLDVGAVKNIARKYSIGTFFKSDFLKTFE
jgi:DNA polymerase-1